MDPGPTCPVVPLGERDGFYYFLDPRGAFRKLTARQLGTHAELLGLLLGITQWLFFCFPRCATRRVNNELCPVVVGYSVSAACAWLMEQCARQPMFHSDAILRRPGVWPGENGEPIVHCGDVLWIDGDLQRAGMRTGKLIWPAAPAEARPGKPCGPETVKHIQLQMQQLWKFRQGGGAIVALGTIGSALYGACPRWRASLFIGGEVGGGKTYLLDTLRACCPMHYHTSDTTKAGLEQNITGKALPSFIDEASDQADQRGAQNLLGLITASAGGEGAKIARGTGDGRGRSAEVIGAVIMASVAPPDMLPQHLARIAMLELQVPSAGEDHRAAMDALNAYCHEHAPAIWARVLIGYKRYVLALAAFRDALGRIGCAPRQMDQLGAILAGFWVLTEDGVPGDREALNLVAAVREHVQDATEIAQHSAGRQVADHLATSRLEGDRSSEKWPVAEMCVSVWEAATDPETGLRVNPVIWRERLGRNGLCAVRADEIRHPNGQHVVRGGDGDGVWIAYNAVPVVKLFENTPFSGQRFRHPLLTLPSACKARRQVTIGHKPTLAAIWLSRADLLGE